MNDAIWSLRRAGDRLWRSGAVLACFLLPTRLCDGGRRLGFVLSSHLGLGLRRVGFSSLDWWALFLVL